METVLLIAAAALLVVLLAAILLAQKRKQEKLQGQLADLAQQVSAASVRLQIAETVLALVDPQSRFLTAEPAMWQKAVAILNEHPAMSLADVAGQLGCSAKTLQAQPEVQAAKRRSLWGYQKR